MEKLEFILQASLEEYKTLRSEIMQSIRLRQNMINYSVLIFTGILTLTAAVFSGRFELNTTEDVQIIILLIIPWLFYPLALIYLRHDLLIAVLASCIEHKISPKINKLLNTDDHKWEWEGYIHTFRKSSHQKFLAGVRYIPLLLPSFISLFCSYFTLYQKFEDTFLREIKFNILRIEFPIFIPIKPEMIPLTYIIFLFNITIFILIVLFIIFKTLSIENEITKLK